MQIWNQPELHFLNIPYSNIPGIQKFTMGFAMKEGLLGLNMDLEQS